jgi:LPXTG-motif cell wall-anchored protein
MSSNKKIMDNNTTLYIAGGITLIAGLIGFFVYQRSMGSAASSMKSTSS